MRGEIVSEGMQQTETIFCNTCNTVTDHLLRARYSTPRIESVNKDDPDPVRHEHRYSLWSCAGCKEATLEIQRVSEDSDVEWAAVLLGQGRSLRDSDATDQILESRIGGQAVDRWLYFEIDHQIVVFLETPFQPFERALLITHPHTCFCHKHGGHIG